MERAVRAAGARTNVEVGTSWTTPATWSYPTVRMGAFTLVLGLVFSLAITVHRANCARGLLRKGFALAMRHSTRREDCSNHLRKRFPPSFLMESFGGLIVSEHSAARPEVPSFVGFWVPSNDLKRRYHSYSLEQIMVHLRERIAEARDAWRVWALTW